jgi:hypothetical protein
MFLFLSPSASEFDTGGKSIQELFSDAAGASSEPVKKILSTVQSIQDSALKAQRSIFNIGLDDANQKKFRVTMEEALKSTLDIGGTFKDVAELTTSFVDGLGAAIPPTQTVLTNMVEFSKATGIANAETAKMYASFAKFTFSQQKAQENMDKISLRARSSGLDVKAVFDDVTKNLTKINSMGFSSGIEGLTKMALQAKALKVNIDEIGAMSLSQTLWDPKKSIELAQNMQMYGGNVGKLGDAFQVFRMGAYDAEGLQEEMINLTAQAFKFNEATGEYETTFTSRQRLKAQADAMNMDYQKAVEIGKERKKQLDIEEKIKNNVQIAAQLKPGGKISEDQLTLIKTLTEFKKGADGKMKLTMDIPGFKTDDLEEQLKNNPEAIIKGLEDYQNMAKKDDREIALQNLSVTEKQAIDVKQLRDMMYLSLDDTDRKKLVNSAENLRLAAEKYGEAIRSPVMGATGAAGVILNAGAGGAPATSVRAREDRERELARQRADPFADVARDLFIGGGNNKIITDEKGGFVKKLIKEDDIVAFPKAGQMIDKLANFYNDTIITVNSIANKIGSVKINESAFNVEELIRKQKSFVETISSKQKTETAEKTVKEEQKITFDDIKLTVDVKGMTPELNKIFQDKNVVNEFKNMIIGEIAKQGQRVNKKGFFGSK